MTVLQDVCSCRLLLFRPPHPVIMVHPFHLHQHLLQQLQQTVYLVYRQAFRLFDHNSSVILSLLFLCSLIVGAVVGGVVGCLLLIVLVIVLITIISVLCRRHLRQGILNIHHLVVPQTMSNIKLRLKFYIQHSLWYY